MIFRFAVRLALFAAVLAVPADALGAGTVTTFSATERIVAPGGRPSTIRLACPPGDVALNAAITRKGSGAIVRRSIPGERSGDWAFRVAGVRGAGPRARSVTAVIRCIGTRLPEGLTHARLNVKTLQRGGIALDPGESRTVRVGCGRGWTATGYGLDAGRRGDVGLAAAVPEVASRWRFTLENRGSSVTLSAVSARCLRSTVTARRSGGGSAELRFPFLTRSFTRAFESGPLRRTATAACGGRAFSVAAGLEIDRAHPMDMRTATPVRSSGARWTFANVAAGDAFRGSIVCLARGGRFR